MNQKSEARKTSNDNGLLHSLRLIRSENIGPITFYRLLRRYGNAESALRALPELARMGGRIDRPLNICSIDDAEKEIESVHKYGAEFLSFSDACYPELLKELDYAPPILTIKGNPNILKQQIFAVVGARNCSGNGRKICSHITSDLSRNDWIVASGLARGIDTTAHQTSLETGTIAVIAGGIDQVYPLENQDLYDKICDMGLIIAESPFGTQPQSTMFPRRNRIISGISRATLVVEAAIKSGSLITARYAIDQNREVFAVPGSPLDPRARGTNHLIKQGAILTESYDDIDKELSSFSTRLKVEEAEDEYVSTLPVSADLEGIRKKVMDNLGYSPISVDSMIRELEENSSDIWAVLLELEIAGRLERHPGGNIALKAA